MNLDSVHPNVVFFLVIVAVLWLAARGRLANLVAAIEGKRGQNLDIGAPSSSGGSSGGRGGGALPSSYGGGPMGGQPSGYPPAGLFLDVAPVSYLSGFDAGARGMDTSGIQSIPGHQSDTAAADWDYGVPTGSAVHLPGGSGQAYKVLHSWEPGRTVIVGTPGGGVMEFLHLSADYVTQMEGNTLHGGDVIGLSGAPSGPLEMGSGAHLAVVVDAPAQQWILGQGQMV